MTRCSAISPRPTISTQKVSEAPATDPQAVNVLLVRGDSPRLRALAADDVDVFRFKRLPMVAVKGRHPVLSETLREVVDVLPVQPGTYRLLWCINRVLLEADALARIWAPNGNRWAVQWDGPHDEAGYPVQLPDQPPQRVPSFVAGIDPIGIPHLDSDFMRWTRVAQPAVLRLSLQSGSLARPDRVAMAVATRTASDLVPVLVAAGNWGRGRRSRLSPLATFPWTISVAAMGDEDGTALHPCSSVGTATREGRPAVGPDIAAYGENTYLPGTFGTSFAVPRAAQQLVSIVAFLLQLAEAQARIRTGEIAGVPLPLALDIDVGYEGYDPRPPRPLTMLPFVGVDLAAVAAALSILDGAGLQLNLGPRSAERILLASARPVAALAEHEVGRGFVDGTTTRARLQDFSGEDLLDLCCPARSNVDESTRRRLRDVVVADGSAVPVLQSCSNGALLRYSMELSTGKVRATMRSPTHTAGTTLFQEERSDYRWPPDTLPEVQMDSISL